MSVRGSTGSLPGLLIDLGTLTALTGARTPVVWFKMFPGFPRTSDLSGADGPGARLAVGWPTGPTP